MFLFREEGSAFGLDISNLSLKIAQLKSKNKKLKIQALGKIDLPHDAIEDGEIKNPKIVIEAITNLVAKPAFGNLTSNEVVACLPDSRTFIKLIDIDKTPNSLSKTIGAEIEKHIPYQINEVYYDWQAVRTLADSYMVLIGAVPKNIVEQYIDILKQAKLSICALEIEAVSICRSLLAEESKRYSGKYDKNYCIIDIGAYRSSIIIYVKNSIALSLSIPISSKAVTEKIAKTLEIKWEQAEKAKIICGLDKSQAHGIVSDILSEMIDDLISKIRSSIDFFTKHYGSFGQINEILLTGGGSNIRSLNNIITAATNIPTRQTNTFINLDEASDFSNVELTEKHDIGIKDFKNVKLSKNISIKQNASRSYATSIGLALRNFFVGDI